MKIGIIYYKYPLYEKGSYIQEFVDALTGESDQVILISSPCPSKDFFRPKNLKIIWIPILNIPFIGDIIFNVTVFFSAIFSDFTKVDVINVVSARGALAAYLLGKIYGKPVICSIEIINSNENNSLIDRAYNLFQRFVYTLKYDKIICWSRFYYDKYLQKWGVSSEKVDIIPGGINISRYNPNVSGDEIRKKFLGDKEYLIVFAKPMYEYNRKTAELLLESVNLLKNDVKIKILLGDGEQRSVLEEKIEKLGMCDSVSFMPFVSIDEIPSYLAASDLIVLSFTYPATTSRSLLEAMAMGKAVVVTDVGEISNVVTDKKNSFVVPVDKNEIARLIGKIIGNRAILDKAGESARELVEEKYAIGIIAQKTINVFNEVIDDRKKNL
ncbi:glycosyltransferase family 4 protein [Patescibacteria group bacterium]